MKSKSPVQLPPRNDYVYYGAHGFDNTEEKMRTIFFARGPGNFLEMLQHPEMQFPILKFYLKIIHL